MKLKRIEAEEDQTEGYSKSVCYCVMTHKDNTMEYKINGTLC